MNSICYAHKKCYVRIKNLTPVQVRVLKTQVFFTVLFLRLFYGMVKKSDLLNLNTRVQINNIEWIA